LLALNHIASFFSSVFAWLIRAGRSELAARQAVSSAKSKEKKSFDKGRSLMKQRKSMGPSVLPCKTQISIDPVSESDPLTLQI